jgi:hypothetical protein
MAKKFWDTLDITVTGSATNEEHAHGLDGIPDIVILSGGGDSHAEITVGTTAPDATSIYLSNANVADQDCVVLVAKLHTLVDS